MLSFDAMLVMHKFLHLSKQGITLFLFQKTEKKMSEVIQLRPQSRTDLSFLNHVPGVQQQEALPMSRQCQMGCKPNICTKL